MRLDFGGGFWRNFYNATQPLGIHRGRNAPRPFPLIGIMTHANFVISFFWFLTRLLQPNTP